MQYMYRAGNICYLVARLNIKQLTSHINTLSEVNLDKIVTGALNKTAIRTLTRR